eukprot:s1474_g3.t1
MICVQGFINYSSVILCAYPLCMTLGVTDAASMSGFYIGVYMTASAVGTAVCWKILNMFPDSWQNGGVKHFLLGGLSCQLLGALGFVKIALDGRDTDDNSWLYFLMGARVLQGFGHGMNDQVMKCCIVKLSPVADRPIHSLNKFVANTVGIGSGPILVALVFFFFESPHEEQESAKGSQISIITASLQFWTTSAVLAATAQLYPTMKVAATDSSKAVSAQGHQASVLVVSLAMDALRAFIVSGVESATCLLLQERFQWGHDSIGFCIGVYTTLGIVATVLLGAATYPQTILAADSIIFPTTYLAGALNMGILNSNVFPDGSLLDANNAAVLTRWRKEGTIKLYKLDLQYNLLTRRGIRDLEGRRREGTTLLLGVQKDRRAVAKERVQKEASVPEAGYALLPSPTSLLVDSDSSSSEPGADLREIDVKMLIEEAPS